jgi:O-antigen ligase
MISPLQLSEKLALRRLQWTGLIAAAAISFLVAFAVPLFSTVESRIARLLASTHAVYLPLELVVGLAALIFLVKHAELAVSLFYIIGFFKGDPHLEAAPIDLTVAVAIIIILAIMARWLFEGRIPQLPKSFIFYVPIIALMLISLTYTPDFDAGLDKTARFLFLTMLGAVAPFVLVDTPAKIWRFLAGLVIGGIGLSISSFYMLGGEDRLTAPSGDTIGLGLSAGLAAIIIWTLWFPAMPLFKRILFYPAMAILAVALIGSGGRLANVGTTVCFCLGVVFCPKLLIDLGIMVSAGALALPFIRIPAASYEYLESLWHLERAFGTRTGLMDYGVKIFLEHPLFGVGVQGYRFNTPNPVTYNFPHNLILELGAELGVFAVIAFIALVTASYSTMSRVLRDRYGAELPLYRTVFLMLVLACLDASVSGEMNNDRLLFFAISMPFVLERIVQQRMAQPGAVEDFAQLPAPLSVPSVAAREGSLP